MRIRRAPPALPQRLRLRASQNPSTATFLRIHLEKNTEAHPPTVARNRQGRLVGFSTPVKFLGINRWGQAVLSTFPLSQPGTVAPRQPLGSAGRGRRGVGHAGVLPAGAVGGDGSLRGDPAGPIRSPAPARLGVDGAPREPGRLASGGAAAAAPWQTGPVERGQGTADRFEPALPAVPVVQGEPSLPPMWSNRAVYSEHLAVPDAIPGGVAPGLRPPVRHLVRAAGRGGAERAVVEADIWTEQISPRLAALRNGAARAGLAVRRLEELTAKSDHRFVRQQCVPTGEERGERGGSGRCSCRRPGDLCRQTSELEFQLGCLGYIPGWMATLN